jgi:hypothetical protein
MNLGESVPSPTPPPPVVPPTPPAIYIPNTTIRALAQGMQAHYLAYITGTTREMALSAVKLVWSVHPWQVPTAENTYDMLNEATNHLLTMVRNDPADTGSTP